MVQQQTGYGFPSPTNSVFPSPFIAQRDPTTADGVGKGFVLGQQWVNNANNTVYVFTSEPAGSATWSLSTAGASQVDTLTGDAGGAISPAGGNITLAGGTNITSTGAGSTITFDLDASLTIATSISSPIYTSTGVATNINAAAGNNLILQMGDAAGANIVSFEDSASVEVASLNSDGNLTTLGTTVSLVGTNTASTASIAIGTGGNTVNLNTGINTVANVVNVSSGAAGADSTVNILSGNATAGVQTLNLGTGNRAKTINIGNGIDGNTIAVGNGINTTAQTINIANGASGADSTVNVLSGIGTVGAGVLALGNNTRVTTIGVGNIAPAAARTTTIAGGNSAQNDTVSVLNGAPSANTQTFNVLSGTATGGTQALNLGNGIGGALTVNMGNGINSTAQTVNIANGASAAASTVNILSGVGTAGASALNMGNNTRITTIGLGDIAPAASRTTTVGGGTVIVAAVTDTVDIGPDGATTNANSVKTVNVNTGGVTLGQVLTNIASGAVTSGTHTTGIATGNRAAGTMALNVMTGTGTKTANLGNADALTTFNIDAITLVNDSVNAATSINTGTSTGAVAIGNAAAGAMSIDTAAGISLDAATVSNFTVTGAGADLNLLAVGGSVLVDSTENAALAIRLHANGGVTETIQIHSDQGTGVGSVNVLSDVGGITLTATGLASADAINLEATAGGIDMDSALQTNITSSQNAADAIRILASAGGIDIDAVGAAAEDIVITNTGGSVSLVATEATADAIVLNASDAAGGIDLLTGGGEITISSAGNVTMVPATATVAGVALTINARVGVATFTGLTTAAAATETLTITNSTLGAGDGIFCTVSNRGTNDAQMTLTRVNTQTAGTLIVQADNNGAAALNGDLLVTFWIIN